MKLSPLCLKTTGIRLTHEDTARAISGDIFSENKKQWI